jgi:hypothetical protein
MTVARDTIIMMTIAMASPALVVAWTIMTLLIMLIEPAWVIGMLMRRRSLTVEQLSPDGKSFFALTPCQ